MTARMRGEENLTIGGLRRIGAISFLTLGALAASCGPRPLGWSPDPASQADPGTSPSSDSPAARAERENWRRSMARVPLPGNGCFLATRATSTWEEVPCQPPSRMHFSPRAIGESGLIETVGGNSDYMAQTTSTSNPITWAEGSFPIVNGLTTETDSILGPNKYGLQLNTNQFPGPQLCQGASVPANCLGWQQFIYIPGGLQMEYWLLNYNNSCDAIGWQTYLPGGGTIDCYKNSDSAPTPFEPPTNLQNLTVMAQSGASDTAFFSSGNDSLYAQSATSVLGLNSGGWTAAEFNIFGYENSSQAVFNDGVVMVVQTLTNMAQLNTTPSCLLSSTTAETNSLSLTPLSCCPVPFNVPGIQFMQSNNNAGAQSCPLAPSQLQVPVAFQANTNFLWVDQGGNGLNQGFGMKAGTVPRLVTSATNQVRVGFQANTGHFWMDSNGIGTDSGKAMQGTTSPSIGREISGQTAVSFQGSNGHLWFGTGGPLSAVDTNAAMKAGSSPSLTVLPNGQYAVGFQGVNGHFWVYQNGVTTDSGRVMQGATSPSLAAQDNSQIVVSFQGSNGHLWLGTNGVNSSIDSGFAMKANTSPSAAVLIDNSVSIAFQGSNGDVWLWHSAFAFDTGFGMQNSASPILSAMPGAGYQIAFKANTGNLWIDFNGNGIDQHLGMN